MKICLGNRHLEVMYLIPMFIVFSNFFPIPFRYFQTIKKTFLGEVGKCVHFFIQALDKLRRIKSGGGGCWGGSESTFELKNGIENLQAAKDN